MIDVLVYVYENYWRGDACPEAGQLERKLAAVGFEAAEIEEALVWLDGLNFATQSTGRPAAVPETEAARAPASAEVSAMLPQSAHSLRVYSAAEQSHLGAECLGFVSFLENAGVLPAYMREIVVDRAMAARGGPLALEDLKVMVLMVYWSFGEEPDALVLDELCDDASDRIAH
jgi:Smg protein